MNTTLIMSGIHLGNENVVIDNTETISPSLAAKREIEIRDINRENQGDVINELERLKGLLMKWNIHADPKPRPLHIDYDDYGPDRRKEYQQAKDDYYKDYMDNCKELNINIKNLQGINTQLCIDGKKEEDDIKIKEGTFYSADDQKVIDEQNEKRRESKRIANAKQYEKNQQKIKDKNKIKNLQKKVNTLTDGIDANNINSHLIKTRCIIKPMCVCGKLCDVTKFETIKKHSKCQKHLLFKSIIKLIHYKRGGEFHGGRNLKRVIKRLEAKYLGYKKVVRVLVDGKSKTIIDKTDKDIIKLWNDSAHEFDENKANQPRESYIDLNRNEDGKFIPTDNYQCNLFLCRVNLNKTVFLSY